MDYTNELLTKIIQVGTLGYPLSKIINVLDIEDETAFKKDFYNKKHIVYKNYNKGLDKADLVIDSKLFDMAKNGDLKALEKYQFRKNRYQDQFDGEADNRK